MRSFELGRKTAVDAPARLALASPSVTRLPGGQGRPGGTSHSLRRRSGPGESLSDRRVSARRRRAGRAARQGVENTGRRRSAEAWEGHDADRAALHHDGPVALCGDRRSGWRSARSATRTARSSSGWTASRCRTQWSQVAADILAQKYFRKAGVPARLKKVEENDVPSWLWRSVRRRGGARRSFPRTSAPSPRLDASRCSTGWPAPGPTGAGRAAISPPRRTRRPSSTSCATCWPARWCAPNSPQWFNTGLHWAYGIDGPGQGHYYVDHRTGELDAVDLGLRASAAACLLHPGRRATTSSTRAASWICGCARRACSSTAPAPARTSPRCAARARSCRAAARSSGLMSFLKIGDRAAGAIKSGGTTRRAAKMVVVDIDHPDIEAYIDWKVNEEQKVAALVTGSKICQKHLKAIMKACVNCEAEGDACFDPREEPGAEARDQARAPRPWCRTTTSSASSSSPARATRRSSSRSTTPTGIRRPTSPSRARTPTTRCRVTDEFLARRRGGRRLAR